jgi:hypothetical protein
MTREESPGREEAISPTLNARNVQAERDVIIQQIINNTTIQQYKESKRKQWRSLEVFRYRTWNLEHDLAINYPIHLIVGMHRVFAKEGYTAFTSNIEISDHSGPDDTYSDITLITHQIRFLGEVRSILTSLWDEQRPREERQAIQEQEKSEALALQKSWQLNYEVLPTKDSLPYEFVYDPDGRYLQIRPHGSAPISPDEYPEKLQRTSELLLFLNVLKHPNILLTYDISTVNQHYGLAKLFVDILDGTPLSLGKIRINTADYEEWDYLNPQADLEFGRASKAS